MHTNLIRKHSTVKTPNVVFFFLVLISDSKMRNEPSFMVDIKENLFLMFIYVSL